MGSGKRYVLHMIFTCLRLTRTERLIVVAEASAPPRGGGGGRFGRKTRGTVR